MLHLFKNKKNAKSGNFCSDLGFFLILWPIWRLFFNFITMSFQRKTQWPSREHVWFLCYIRQLRVHVRHGL